MKAKLVRITTVPVSMNIILKGQLTFMNQYFNVIGVTGYDKKHFNEVAKREGIRMIPVEMSRPINPVKDISALWKLYKILRAEKPEIVHTHTPKAGLLGMLAAFFAGVPVRLHTVGGLPLMEVKGAKRVLLNWVEKLTYACAHRVYPNSLGLKEFIEQQKFCSPSKLKVIANGGTNGINSDFFKPDYRADPASSRESLRLKLGIAENELVFCLVGRLAREKGIGELVEAFVDLQQKYLIKLVLVGPVERLYGMLSDELQKALNNNSNILLPGRFDDVRPYYGISDIYVFPSYREGFPNSVLEAGAMGLPVIATDINGCNEIIEHNINGLLIQPKSVSQLKKAMQQMLDEPELRKQLAANARPRVLEKFRREVIWQALEEEYEHQLKLRLHRPNA